MCICVYVGYERVSVCGGGDGGGGGGGCVCMCVLSGMTSHGVSH